MLGGYLEFFMKPGMAETYLNLKRELEDFIQLKVSKAHYSGAPLIQISIGNLLMLT